MQKLTIKHLSKSSIFLGAFLLFFLQPLITKILLPYFGGGQMVWITSLVFFQVFLLLGYLYAHLLTARPLIQQKRIHISLLLISFFILLFLNAGEIQPNQQTITFDLLKTLTIRIGLPFILLAATSPIVQYWVEPDEKDNTFHLYALSNIASIGALLLYPFIVEPIFGLRIQTSFYIIIYVCFFLSISVLLNKISKPTPHKLSFHVDEKIGAISSWILLPAIASSLLVAISNELSLDISPTPFIWIIPLLLYLLTFIYTFSNIAIYTRKLFLLIYAAVILKYVMTQGAYTPIVDALITYGGVIFITAFICHGELYAKRPTSNNLTFFYLCISIGGAIGGIFSGLIAPLLFTTQLEIPIALSVLALYLLYQTFIDTAFLDELKAIKIKAFSIGLVIFSLTGTLFVSHYKELKNAHLIKRNFFGILQVIETDTEKQLLHGITLHGFQLQGDTESPIPTSYYGKGTAVEQAIRLLPEKENLSLGVIGLGTGAMAGYRDVFSSVDYYEIDQDIIDIANTEFTFLRSFPGELNIHYGDARIVLENQESKQFDLLVVDAFSSDAIPTHLVTKEALAMYQQHLAPNGAIAFHVSNRYIDLEPVIKTLADDANLFAKRVVEEAEMPEHSTNGDWVIITSSPIALGEQITESTRIWTDDYSSILPIISL